PRLRCRGVTAATRLICRTDAMRRCLAAEAFAETSVATASSANAGTVADNMIVTAATAANARESLFILHLSVRSNQRGPPPAGSCLAYQPGTQKPTPIMVWLPPPPPPPLTMLGRASACARARGASGAAATAGFCLRGESRSACDFACLRGEASSLSSLLREAV